MKLNFENREELAQFVEDLLVFSSPSSLLTMTIIPEKSGAFCVLIATDVSSDDCDGNSVAQFFSQTQVNI